MDVKLLQPKLIAVLFTFRFNSPLVNVDDQSFSLLKIKLYVSICIRTTYFEMFQYNIYVINANNPDLNAYVYLLVPGEDGHRRENSDARNRGFQCFSHSAPHLSRYILPFQVVK